LPFWVIIDYNDSWHQLSYVYICDEPSGVIFLKDW